ncbi:MAG: hypothetical protein ACTHMD_18815 [Flavisolibacter sp.]
MKMKFLATAFICSAIILTACQKEAGQDQPSVNTSDRVKTYTETITSSSIGNSSTTFNISYDSKGRVTSAVSANYPGDKFVYAFPSDNKFTMDLYNSNELSIHEDFYLNAASFIDSTFQYNDTEDSSTEKYTYNANNQLITLKEYDYSKLTGSSLYNTTAYTYDASGNLIKSLDTDGEMHTYEYYPDLSYALPLITGPLNSGATQKRNLVKKHTLSYGGVAEASAQYTYTFDDKNRISTEKAEISDGSITTKTYTYF